MKNLFVTSFLILTSFFYFSQKITVHVTKVNKSVYKLDTLRYTIENNTNTTYIIDADKGTMSINFTNGRKNIKNKKVDVTKKSGIYYVKYKDTDMMNAGSDMDIVITINTNSKNVQFKNEHYVFKEKSITKVVIDFLKFNLKVV
jgi:hypothetical protein